MRLQTKETISFPPPSTDGEKGGFQITDGEMNYVPGRKDRYDAPHTPSVGPLRQSMGSFYLVTFFIMAGTDPSRSPRDFDVLRKLMFKVYYCRTAPFDAVTAQYLRDFIAKVNLEKIKTSKPDPNWEGLGVHFFTFMAELLELSSAKVDLYN